MTTDSNTHGFDSSMLPADFITLLSNCSHAQKKAMLIAIRNSLNSDLSNIQSASSSIDFSQYVDIVKNFVPEDFLDDAIFAEVESMGLCKNSAKPLTQWLSFDDRPYCFSDNPNSRHDSKKLHDYPAIFKLMELVNSDTRTTQDANSALVIVYNNNRAAIGFHDDNETIIDNNSSIATVTFGSARSVEFCDRFLRPCTAQHSVECENHDMMVMKAGCQKTLVHRVQKGNSEPGSGSSDIRIVISFRKIVESNYASDSDPELSIHLAPAPEDIVGTQSLGTDSVSESTPSQGTDILSSPRRVSIIAGDSHAMGLDVERLGRKGRKSIVNLAKGGATISQVGDQIESYFLSFSDVGQTPIVEKIIVCVGTNDIRNCRENGVRHLKRPLFNLIEKIKLLFPNCSIWFQSLIPLIVQNQFMVPNVDQFNKLLFEVCLHMRIYFLTVFGFFLQFDRERNGLFRNEHFFVHGKNIHLNKIGLSMLARAYMKVIHSNRFNPLGY